MKFLNPKHYFNEFKQLLNFVITPSDSSGTLTTAQKIEGTWTMFVVKFILAIIVGVSIGIFYDAENKTTISMAERFSPIALLFVTIIALPLLEEVEFRLSLKFKPVFLALTLGALTYSILSKTIYTTKLSDINHYFMERVSYTLAVFLLAYPLFSFPKVKRVFARFWQNNFRWIFYGSCLAFAWVHIFNYELTLTHLLLTPLLTIDKLVSAMCYGYTRVNYGFLYSMAIHMFNNSIGFLVGMINGSI